MQEKTICSVCGATLTEETKREFDGKVMCETCLEGCSIVCDCCGERVRTEDAQSDSHTTVCNRCYDFSYTTCERCGRIISTENAYYLDDVDDAPYCCDCHQHLSNQVIKSYNYKPEPIFYGSGSLFMGVELEIDKGGEDNNNAEILLNMANRHQEHLYCKHDGSLNEGFEMVSHPMTLEYHENNMRWSDIFEQARDLGYRSHQTQTCGLHIHVSRSAFGKTYEDQEEVISRIVYFVEKHWNELLKFSRRTESNMDRWASRYGILTTAKDTYKNAKDKRMGRYVAVNLENYATIEFRLFRGTLNHRTFLATLQLVDEICKMANLLPDKKLEGLSWSDFVIQIPKSKKELIDYLKSRFLYVNEPMNTREEI